MECHLGVITGNGTNGPDWQGVGNAWSSYFTLWFTCIQLFVNCNLSSLARILCAHGDHR